ncbi:hypothetical protein CBR_g19519 [Chara braunii]|uniref:Uncharacterized protein n=1 Tax=Chara braunii TaxID=69332 RepID=A0A388KY73_CHABU|nr:hypothetical protein CBR_g19519 [Chara braunii]|eukprot:GBG75005.1 hypothetical protein CBR_g19519 [Chara braunii]
MPGPVVGEKRKMVYIPDVLSFDDLCSKIQAKLPNARHAFSIVVEMQVADPPPGQEAHLLDEVWAEVEDLELFDSKAVTNLRIRAKEAPPTMSPLMPVLQTQLPLSSAPPVAGHAPLARAPSSPSPTLSSPSVAPILSNAAAPVKPLSSAACGQSFGNPDPFGTSATFVSRCPPAAAVSPPLPPIPHTPPAASVTPPHLQRAAAARMSSSTPRSSSPVVGSARPPSTGAQALAERAARAVPSSPHVRHSTDAIAQPSFPPPLGGSSPIHHPVLIGHSTPPASIQTASTLVDVNAINNTPASPVLLLSETREDGGVKHGDLNDHHNPMVEPELLSQIDREADTNMEQALRDDLERRAVIYTKGKNGVLTGHMKLMNAAAKQIALRDPRLVEKGRRAELMREAANMVSVLMVHHTYIPKDKTRPKHAIANKLEK